MKTVLYILLFFPLCIIRNHCNAQQSEITGGMGFSAYYNSITLHRDSRDNMKNGSSFSLYFRYIGNNKVFSLKHFDAGLEQYSGRFYLSEFGGSGGGGSQVTDVSQNKIALSLNEYLLNYRSFNQSFLFSAGLNFNIAILNFAKGFYQVSAYKLNNWTGQYYWDYNTVELKHFNAPEMNILNAGIALKFTHNGWNTNFGKIKMGISSVIGFTNEMREANSMINFRCRLEIAKVIAGKK